MPTTRVQLALNVEDLQAAADFYTKLFGVAPHKERAGYVNFAIEDPPLKLVLFEDAEAPGTLNHLGIEAPTTDAVTAAGERFRAAGLDTSSVTDDLCCHAVQDKVFVTAPALAVRRDSAALGPVIDNRQITTLPLDGRNVLELALLAGWLLSARRK